MNSNTTKQRVYLQYESVMPVKTQPVRVNIPNHPQLQQASNIQVVILTDNEMV